jgi:hypothetical protein
MKNFNQQLQEQFARMCATGKLFRSEISGHALWTMYLKAFSKEHDPVFRDPASSYHNCNHCNNFVRRYGNIVALDANNNIITIFDVLADEEYKASALAMATAVKQANIKDIFIETFDELNSLPYESCKKTNDIFRLGTAVNYKQYNATEAAAYGHVEVDKTYTFNHMHLDLPKQFVSFTNQSIEAISGEFRDAKNVFKRAMDEISADTLILVRDLIIQGSLLDGNTHLHKVETILGFKQVYDTLAADKKDNWCWITSYKFPLAKFRNELIGTLCVELSEGKEINEACKTWNYRVDPVNYMKAVAPISKRQIEEAQKFVEENGFTESFDRRMATIDDIKVSEILHANGGNNKIKNVSIFDGVKPAASTRHKRNEFDGVEEVSIEKFISEILPNCSSVEAFVVNEHENNFVTLTTSKNPNSIPIFKWDNNYSWTFNGNLAGKSQIKQVVKSKGGNIDGVLRFSGIWNDENQNDNSDLDLWCLQPDGVKIGFNTGYRKDSGNKFTALSGQLDLDDRGNVPGTHAENIYFKELKKMKEGKYTFWINQFRGSNSKGFKAEIEVDGKTFNYSHNSSIASNKNINVATVVYKNGEFTVEHNMPCSEGEGVTKEFYGLETNQFHKVNLVCLSPNHWDENKVGNKHYFFMLENCISPTPITSFHMENLIPDLAKHRKVLETLGTSIKVDSIPKQLSGLGFNATVKDELIVKLSGSFKRTVKIKF